MKKRDKSRKKRNVPKWLFWAPRILSIVFILFISLFALDIFEMNLGFWGTIVGLFMHLIPSIILAIVLLIAWKYEIVGAIAYFFAGLLYIIILMMNQFEWYMLSWIIQIAGPAFLIGILFLMNWIKKRK